MAQQFHNGGKHDGAKTVSIRDTYRYAIVNDPFTGKHRKPQTAIYRQQRKIHWFKRKLGLI